MTTNSPDPEIDQSGLLGELTALDEAIYVAVATSAMPTLDEYFRRLSRTSDTPDLRHGPAEVITRCGWGGASLDPPNLQLLAHSRRCALRRAHPGGRRCGPANPWLG